jgi:hypothetical protein
MHNYMKIMNSFYTQKYTHTHMVSSQFQNSYRLFHCKQEAIRTIPRSEFTEEIILVYFLTLAKLRFPPKWLHLPMNTAHKWTWGVPSRSVCEITGDEVPSNATVIKIKHTRGGQIWIIICSKFKNAARSVENSNMWKVAALFQGHSPTWCLLLRRFVSCEEDKRRCTLAWNSAL